MWISAAIFSLQIKTVCMHRLEIKLQVWKLKILRIHPASYFLQLQHVQCWWSRQSIVCTSVRTFVLLKHLLFSLGNVNSRENSHTLPSQSISFTLFQHPAFLGWGVPIEGQVTEYQHTCFKPSTTHIISPSGRFRKTK